MNIENLKRQAVKNPLMTILVGTFAISLLCSLPKMMGDHELRSKFTEKKDRAKYREIELKLDEEVAETEAKIARKRFLAGCKIALDKADPTKYLDLVEGQKIPLPEGTPVCSRSGHIGVVKSGRLTNIVYDGQPESLHDNHRRVFNGSIHLAKIKT